MRLPLFIFITVIASVLFGTRIAVAADADQPQGHRGLLTPITSSPTPVALTASEKASLAAGKHIERHTKGSDGGSGVAIQYIKASPAVIWQTILSYHRYKDWVANVVHCSVYKREGSEIYIDMQTSIFGFKSTVFTRTLFVRIRATWRGPVSYTHLTLPTKA